MQRSTTFWLLIATCAGITLFLIKGEVQEREDRLSALNRQILADQEAIQVLNAEWSYLNRPDRLEHLIREFSERRPANILQLTSITMLPQLLSAPEELIDAKTDGDGIILPMIRPVSIKAEGSDDPYTPHSGRYASSGKKPEIRRLRQTGFETGPYPAAGRGSVFALAFIVIAARVIDVSIFERPEEPRLAEERGTLPQKTGRADIVDRNGMLLATTLNVPSLYADPKYIMDPAASAAKLRTVLPELNHANLVSKFSEKKRFTWIKRNLTPREQYAVNRLGIPGLYFQKETKRLYPQGHLTAHIVGRAGFDDVGLSGIEKNFDLHAAGRRRSSASVH